MAQWDPATGMGLIVEQIRDGASATSALSAFREGGGQIRDSTWYSLYGEARAALANRETLAALDPTVLPLDEHFTPWSSLSGDVKLYQVELVAKDNVTGDIQRVPYSIMTDQVTTGQSAIDDAIAAAEGNLDKYDQTIMGGIIVGLYRAA
jgi:hypothetical protein